MDYKYMVEAYSEKIEAEMLKSQMLIQALSQTG